MKTTTFDFFWFFAPLKNEFAFIATSLELEQEKRNIAFWRRMYIRAFFNLVEAVTKGIKDYLYAEKFSHFKPEEINFLLDQPLNSMNNKRISFVENFKKTFKYYAKVNQKEYELQAFLAQNEFSTFQKSLEIRNNLIHPKKHMDILFSEKQISMISDSYNWWEGLVFEILDTGLIKDKN
jgi:hypothetical protein